MAEAAKEVNKTPIIMADGRVVEFTDRQKCKTRRENGSLYMDFRSGDTLVVTEADVQALRDRFFWHGVEQKYRDEYAAAKSAEDAFEGVVQLHERLKKGEWAEKAEGGMAGASILVKALCEITGQTPAQIRAFLGDKSRAEREIMKDYGPVKAKIDEIRARTPAPDTSGKAAAMLSGLGIQG